MRNLWDQSKRALTRWSFWGLGPCVYDGIAPILAAAMFQAEEEKKTWELAGSKGISFLVAQHPGG
jgi:hypothetical protein